MHNIQMSCLDAKDLTNVETMVIVFVHLVVRTDGRVMTDNIMSDSHPGDI